MNPPSRDLDLLRRAFAHPRLRRVVSWLLALSAAAWLLANAWTVHDNPAHPDGNDGHTSIDFGGQYTMGRMLVTGHARDLYNRAIQRSLLQELYPPDSRAEGVFTEEMIKWAKEQNVRLGGDADGLMAAFVGKDEPEVAAAFAAVVTPLAAPDPFGLVALDLTRRETWPDPRVREWGGKRQIGGPLYPPINAFLYAPLALMPPVSAYRVQQVLNVVLMFAAGLGISFATRGRVWWSMASLLLILFPGAIGSTNLGQNAALTVALAAWGWALTARGRPGWGGVVWGLLAFKPVWALALLIVPLLTGRWRMALAMILTGAALAAATLPVVGVGPWLDWLHVGRLAAEIYKTDQNWIMMSRDLLGVPRRWMVNFARNAVAEPPWRPQSFTFLGQFWELAGLQTVPGWLPPALTGWLLMAFVLEMTVRTAMLRPTQARVAKTGPIAAFVLLGCWLLCYHFIYYDTLIAALPVLLLWHDARDFFKPMPILIATGGAEAADSTTHDYLRPGLMKRLPSVPSAPPLTWSNVWVLNRVVPSLTVLLVLIPLAFPILGLGGAAGPPWDTFVLLALWLWCFVLWMRTPPS